eukprot:CAMPEP_0203895352 /NCGR_PEP_ID=MMETSP0359-20131031/38204_1 /ASSEMBLY_ACC=CAM_ASM_000338 /TAXON_ID=268821 /ORGANISM="Scrippsiella Hangoei, Strain SHTV-5" /LENGTH=198 /DNA_ID=CAMNT_0050817807 /DNA_START=239 /DNA_END=835 /DNA_ORIENTATION=+
MTDEEALITSDLRSLVSVAKVKLILDWLVDTICLDEQQLRILVLKWPRIFGTSIETYKVNVDWLSKQGLSEEQIRSLIKRRIDIVRIEKGIRNRYEPVVAWLSRKGFAKADQVKVMTALPEILNYKVDTLEEKVAILSKYIRPLSEVVKILVRDPRLLRVHVSRIQDRCSILIRRGWDIKMKLGTMHFADAQFAARFE